MDLVPHVSRFAMAACTALLVLALFTNAASANRVLRITGERAITAEGEIEFREITRNVRIACELTLQGEFTRAEISKAAARRLPEGWFLSITSSRSNACVE